MIPANKKFSKKNFRLRKNQSEEYLFSINNRNVIIPKEKIIQDDF